MTKTTTPTERLRRTPFGYRTDDSEILVERGARMTHGVDAWLIWRAAPAESVVEDEYGAYGAPGHASATLRRRSEVTGEDASVDDDRWYYEACESAGLAEARSIIATVRQSEPAVPAEVLASDAFGDSPAGAIRLYRDGFRPVRIEAFDDDRTCPIERGDDVAYVETLLDAPLGPPRSGRVYACRTANEWGDLVVEHSGGDTIAEEGDEVWIRRREQPTDAPLLDRDGWDW